MVTDDRTRFVGVRGLMKQKLEAGDTDTAMKLAEKAMALRPKNEEVQTTLLQLQARNEDWSGARATLSKALKAGNMPRDLHKRRDAVLALAHAREAMAEGKVAEATRSANEANRLAPTLVPAAVMAARLAIAEKKPKEATKILKAAWANEPHPDLAAAFAEIEPNESPTARLKRFQALLAKHPGHPETKLLEAELQIAKEDFPAAKRALGDLAETKPTARSLTIMAAIERGQGAEDRVVRAWLARAVTASRGPQWICGNCGHVHAEWRPICANCESFDTLNWEEAPQSEAALAGPAQMLPLIVGALEDRSGPEPEEAETVEEPTPHTPSSEAEVVPEAQDEAAADTPSEAEGTASEERKAEPVAEGRN
jgi:HemY protein